MVGLAPIIVFVIFFLVCRIHAFGLVSVSITHVHGSRIHCTFKYQKMHFPTFVGH